MRKNIYVAVLIIMILSLATPVMANTSKCSNECCSLGDNGKRNSLENDCSSYTCRDAGGLGKIRSSEEKYYDTDAPRKTKKTTIIKKYTYKKRIVSKPTDNSKKKSIRESYDNYVEGMGDDHGFNFIK